MQKGFDIQKRKLAIILAVSMGSLAAIEVLLAVGLALEHGPYVIPLASITACVPGFVVAALAWRGRLPSKCSASS